MPDAKISLQAKTTVDVERGCKSPSAAFMQNHAEKFVSGRRLKICSDRIKLGTRCPCRTPRKSFASCF